MSAKKTVKNKGKAKKNGRTDTKKGGRIARKRSSKPKKGRAASATAAPLSSPSPQSEDNALPPL